MKQQVQITQYEDQDNFPMIAYSVGGNILFAVHTLEEDRTSYLKLCAALKTDVVIVTIKENGDVKDAKLIDYSNR